MTAVIVQVRRSASEANPSRNDSDSYRAGAAQRKRSQSLSQRWRQSLSNDDASCCQMMAPAIMKVRRSESEANPSRSDGGSCCQMMAMAIGAGAAKHKRSQSLSLCH